MDCSPRIDVFPLDKFIPIIYNRTHQLSAANSTKKIIFCSEEEFPHEIGLFLSYPPENVLGFIQNGACKHKCVGCWKVYGDERAAKNIFEKYDMCSKAYSRQWLRGKSIEQLTVAG